MLHRPFYRLLGKFLKKHDRRQLAAKILLSECFEYAIQNATYVNSRSLLFACDIYPDNPQSSSASLPYLEDIPQKLVQFKNKIGHSQSPTIYVPSDGIIAFAKNILEKIDSPFILVTGDSDLPINTSTLGGQFRKTAYRPKGTYVVCTKS